MSDLEHGSTVGGSSIITQATLDTHTHDIADVAGMGNSAYYNRSDSFSFNNSNSIATSKAVHDAYYTIESKRMFVAGYVEYSGATPVMYWSRNCVVGKSGSAVRVSFNTNLGHRNYIPIVIPNAGGHFEAYTVHDWWSPTGLVNAAPTVSIDRQNNYVNVTIYTLGQSYGWTDGEMSSTYNTKAAANIPFYIAIMVE